MGTLIFAYPFLSSSIPPFFALIYKTHLPPSSIPQHNTESGGGNGAEEGCPPAPMLSPSRLCEKAPLHLQPSPSGSQLILNNLNRQRYLHSQPDWWPYKIDLWIEVLPHPLCPIQAIIDYMCCSEIKEKKFFLKKREKRGLTGIALYSQVFLGLVVWFITYLFII